MDEEVLKNVMELFTKVCKNDVNPIKSYKQYLDELTNEDITNIIIFFSTMIKNEKDLEKINNILTVNSDITSDFIYHIVMCSNDFCKKILDENK